MKIASHAPSPVVSLQAIPNPKKLFESLRHSGYTNEAAIADLVDNSIDANASQIKIHVSPNEGTLAPDKTRIIITDDGSGMTLETLSEAIRLGSDIDKDTSSDLGKFGMGLITASISIARRLTVVTRTEGGSLLRAVHDLDNIAEKQQFGAELYENDQESERMWDEYALNSEHGTIVELTKCDNLSWQTSGPFLKQLSNELGEIFRLFIIAKSKKNGHFQSFLWLNDNPIYAVDPLLMEDRKDFTLAEERKGLTRFSESLDDFEIEVPIDPNHPDGTSDTLKVKVVRLPDFNQTEQKVFGVGTKTEGVYVIRNQRQIARAQTLGLFVRHHFLIRFRAEVQFPATMDKRMGLNWMKQNVRMDQSLLGKIENILGPHVASERRRRAKSLSSEQKVDHAPYQTLIASKAKLLTLPLANGHSKEPSNNGKKRLPRAPISPARPEKDELATLRERCIFQEAKMSPSGPLWDPDMQGRKMIITFNVEHPLWVRYVLESDEATRSQLLELLHMFAFCLSAAEFREFGEDDFEKLVNMRSQMASNIRVLLS